MSASQRDGGIPDSATFRPDLVLYLDGLAIAAIELKRGSGENAHGIRQLITNQECAAHDRLN